MSSRQFSFLTGPNKLDFVRVYASAFTSLVGPPYITLWGRFYFFEFSFSTSLHRDFSLFSIFFFLFSFFRSCKKHKNTNKRLSYFFHLDVFKCISFLLAYLRFCAFAWLHFCASLCVWCFWCFLCFLVRAKSFRKKKIKSSKLSQWPHLYYYSIHLIAGIKFFNYQNLFQLSQSFSIIAIFFNNHSLFQ